MQQHQVVVARQTRIWLAQLDGTLDSGLRMEVDAVVPGLRTANVDEGLAAFQERRTPVFADRET